jgi:serine/threonine-protein kinase
LSRLPGGQPNLEEIADIVGQLASALDHLHARGLVHRDVKPANIFLSEARPARTRVTLLDFGVVCAAGTANGPDAFCVGTLEYAAPEQIAGAGVDGRADVYSLGCVLYELCTGLRPFEADSPYAVAQMHLYRAAAPPSALGAAVPPQIDDLILAMLEKRPSDRPSSAGAAAERFAAARP